MSVIRRIPWTRQPPAGTKIDSGNPITKGLYFAYSPGIGQQRNVVNDDAGTITGSQLVFEPEPTGIAQQGATSSGNYLTFPKIKEPAHMTVFIIAKHTATGTSTNGTLINRNFDGSTVPFHMNITQAAAIDGFGFFDGAWRVAATSNAFAGDNIVHTFCGSYDGVTLRYYADGIQENETSYTGSLPSSNANDIDIGTYQNDSTFWAGEIYQVLIWDRALSAAEVVSLDNDWWQVWQPRTQILPPEVVAGAPNTRRYSLTLTGVG